jgi:hypothetical protein
VAATGEPVPTAEGTTAETLAGETVQRTGAAARPEPVPVWAAVAAGIGLLALLWGLNRFVLPRRPDVNP